MICGSSKYFGDAVPNVGTTASLNLIRIMIDERRVQESEAALWLSHLAFVPRPTRTMLSAVQPLLRTSGEIQRKAALAISSMVHNFCKLNKDCADISEVLHSHLKPKCLIYNLKNPSCSTRCFFCAGS